MQHSPPFVHRLSVCHNLWHSFVVPHYLSLKLVSDLNSKLLASKADHLKIFFFKNLQFFKVQKTILVFPWLNPESEELNAVKRSLTQGEIGIIRGANMNYQPMQHCSSPQLAHQSREWRRPYSSLKCKKQHSGGGGEQHSGQSIMRCKKRSSHCT